MKSPRLIPCIFLALSLVAIHCQAQTQPKEKRASATNIQKIIETTLKNHQLKNRGEKLSASELKRLMSRLNRLIGKGLLDRKGKEVQPTDPRYKEALQFRIIEAYRNLFEDSGSDYVQSNSFLASLDEDMEEAQKALKRRAENDESNLNTAKIEPKLVHYLEENHRTLKELMEHWKKCEVCNGFAGDLGMNPPRLQVSNNTLPGTNRRVAFRCFFYQEPLVQYLVDSNNQIWGVLPTGQSRIVGRRVPALNPRFAWDYLTLAGVRYGVGPDGGIYTPGPFGSAMRIGEVRR